MRRLKRCRGFFYGGLWCKVFTFLCKALLMSWLIISRLSCGNSITSSRSWIQLLFITSLKSIFCFLFVLLSMIKWRFQGVGRRKMAKKTLASRFQCCKECYQFAPYLAFSNFGFFQRYPNLNSATVNYQNFSAAKMRVLIWWWGLFWNLVVDFQQSKQKVKTSFLAL